MILFVYNFIILTYLWLVPLYFFPNKYKIVKKAKCIYENMSLILFFMILQAKLYINKKSLNYEINKDLDKIDIVIANHVSTFDFFFIISILKKYNIDNYSFLFKSGARYLPGIGFSIYVDTDIIVNKKWEDDETLIIKQIDNIKLNGKKELIIIFPEGTRITKEKIINSQKYSKENNLPVYDYLQTPRYKGLWLLINHLDKNNKLGKIWDLTFIRPNYLEESTYASDMLTKPMGDMYIYFRELKLSDGYQDVNIFKLWLYKQWTIKDNIIKNYGKKTYELVDIDINKYKKDIMITFSAFMFMCYLLSNKYGRRYLVFIFILSYMILYKNSKLIKE